MKDVVNVRLVSRYSFEDEKGKKLKGTKVFYDGSIVDSDEKKGVEVLQIQSSDYTAYDQFTKVPGKYEIDFSLLPGKGGQVKMSLNSAKYVG